MTQTVLLLALALPAVLLALVLAVLNYRRKSASRQACEQLLLKIKAADEEFQQGLNHFLADGQRLDPGLVQTNSDLIVDLRRELYRQLFKSVLHNEPSALVELDTHLLQLLNAYHVLLPSLPPPVAASVAPKVDNNQATEELRRENESLRREARITLGTLNNIFAEFASMFGDEVPANNMSLDQILERMQRLSMAPDESASTTDVVDIEALLAAESASSVAVAAPAAETATAAEAEPSWEAAFAEAGEAGGEPSWEDAFAEAEKNEPPA